MEASAAAQGQGDGGQAQQGEAAQPDFGALQSTLQEMRTQVGDLHEFVRSEPWQQTAQEAQDATPEEIDFSWLDPADPGFDPAQIQSGLQEAIDRAADQKLAPLQQQLQQTQQQIQEAAYQREAEALVGEFPELGQREVADQVVKAAADYAQSNFPPEVAQVLAASPQWWRAIYMAGKAAETANQETAQSASAAHLEGGGPAPGGSEVDPVAEIFDSRKGASVLNF